MPRIFTRRQYTPVRRKLRKQATKSEAWLWHHLQNRKLDGYKFRRQHSMGKYILDFFCPENMLAIEVDGVSHEDPATIKNDKIRQQWIECHGVRVVRFTDSEVLGDVDTVLSKIKQALLP